MSEFGFAPEGGDGDITSGGLSYVDLGRVLNFNEAEEASGTLVIRGEKRRLGTGEVVTPEQTGLYSMWKDKRGKFQAVVNLARADKDGKPDIKQTTIYRRLRPEQVERLQLILDEREQAKTGK